MPQVPPAPSLPGAPWVPPDATQSGGPPRRRLPRRPAELRAMVLDRLPELLGIAGTLLVVAAVAGFVASSWSEIGNLGQAGLLAAGAATLSAQAQWSSGRDSAVLARLVPWSWAAAGAMTLAAARLLGDLALPDRPRMAIVVAGVAALVHLGWAWTRNRSSSMLQLALVATAVYTIGPASLDAAADWSISAVALWAAVLVEAFVTGVRGSGQDTLALLGAGHGLLAVGWIALGLRLEHVRAARLGRIGGCILLLVAILEFNAMTSPIGTAIALLLVIAVLVAGISIREPLLVAAGGLAGLVTGLQTLWALFDGEVAVTITIALAGLAMLGGALQMARTRHDRGTGLDDAASHGPH